MSNFWIANFPGGVGQPAAPAYGGGGTDMLAARDPLDAKRQAAGFAPGASYPDGYLGNVGGRQNDKMAVLQTRLTSTSYQRGVHVGEKQPKNAYSWSADMNPMMGLERQMQAIPVDQEGGLVYQSARQTVTGNPVEMLANDGKMASASTREQEQALIDRGGDPSMNPVTQLSPTRAARMQATHMLPRWSGVGGGAI